MPLYEYECQQCRQRLEAIQSFNDEPYSICRLCGGELKKLMSAPAIQFKGSGFHRTDYPSATGSKSSESSGSGESKGESSKGESSKGESSKGESPKGESPKGESKPEARSDKKSGE